MIACLTGKLLFKEPTRVVLQTCDVGYEVRISLTTFTHIKSATQCTLHTHMCIKNDACVLYGFSALDEKEWFMRLINVNGIGPQTAIALLSSLQSDALCQVLSQKDASALEAVKGIGKKAAQRIILELSERALSVQHSTAAGDDSVLQEAVMALTRLGIRASDAHKYVTKAYSLCTKPVALETLIKEALRMS